MTVHASKGLQAPLVILADSGALPAADRVQLLWMRDQMEDELDLPIFCPRKDLHCDRSRAFRQTMQQRATEEHHRLLYVALTRAEDRLIICGWETATRGNMASWHSLAAKGFAAIGAETVPSAIPETEWPGAWLALELAAASAHQAQDGSSRFRCRRFATMGGHGAVLASRHAAARGCQTSAPRAEPAGERVTWSGTSGGFSAAARRGARAAVRARHPDPRTAAALARAAGPGAARRGARLSWPQRHRPWW